MQGLRLPADDGCEGFSKVFRLCYATRQQGQDDAQPYFVTEGLLLVLKMMAACLIPGLISLRISKLSSWPKRFQYGWLAP